MHAIVYVDWYVMYFDVFTTDDREIIPVYFYGFLTDL